jgi:hypothetical protein
MEGERTAQAGRPSPGAVRVLLCARRAPPGGAGICGLRRCPGSAIRRFGVPFLAFRPREHSNFSFAAGPSNDDPSRLPWLGPETHTLKLSGCGRGLPKMLLTANSTFMPALLSSTRAPVSSLSIAVPDAQGKPDKQQMCAWGSRWLVRLPNCPSCSAAFLG